MEVYIANNISGKGLWVTLPKKAEKLLEYLDKNELTDGGEYQMTRIRGRGILEQDCVGNLFQINKLLKKLVLLPVCEQNLIEQFASDNGILFEEALQYYLN